jgi:hypothetical protein
VSRLLIDGVELIEVDTSTLPSGNVCGSCYFRHGERGQSGRNCYDLDEVQCDASLRADGREVVFQVKGEEGA